MNVLGTISNVIVAVLAAVPCGFGLGVIVAYVLTLGRDRPTSHHHRTDRNGPLRALRDIPIGELAKRRNVLLAGAGGVMVLAFIAAITSA